MADFARTTDVRTRMTRTALALGCAAVFAVGAAACGSDDTGSSSSTSTTSAAAAETTAPAGETTAPAGETADVTNAFVTFFSGDTSADAKLAVLQNADAFADTVNAQADSTLAKGTTATVSRVDLDAPGHATVTYTVLMNGQPVLADQMGEAVQVDGTWKVAQSTFCDLLTLEGNAPPVCGATTPAPAPTS